MRCVVLYLCVVLCVFGVVLVCGDSSVYVFAPKAVRESDHRLNVTNIPNKPAMFGVAPWGRSITGVLWYPKNDTNRLACGVKGLDMTQESDYPTGVGGVIVMLDRSPFGATGNKKCSFVAKVAAAGQLVGVVAVIIRNGADRQFVYMADDGTGRYIKTPSVIIQNDVGGLLADAMRPPEGTFVKISMQIGWQIPTKNGTVTWQFWTSAYDEKSTLLKARFGRADAILHNATFFEPKYNFYKGDEMAAQCQTHATEPFCQFACIKNGRYCVDDPDGVVGNWLDGNIALRENVWQMCVWKQIDLKAGVDPNMQRHLWRNKWWQYVSESEATCDTQEELVDVNNEPVFTCRQPIVEAIGLGDKFDTIKRCYIDCKVDVYEDTSPCLILDNMAAEREDRGVFWTPTLLINDQPLLGDLSCNTPLEPRSCQVLAEICAGYTSATRPPLCTAPSTGCDFGLPRDCTGVCNGTASLDACGSCLSPNDPLRNKSCTDCNGQLNGAWTLDKCGVCREPKDPKRGETCTDCSGDVNGLKQKDCAGDCKDKNATDKAQVDDCGVCIRFVDRATAWNKTCTGTVSPGTSPAPSSSSTNWGAVIAIVLAVSGVVGVSIYLYMKRQQNRMREDIDGILKQYLPLQDGVQGQGHIRPTQRLDGNETL